MGRAGVEKGGLCIVCCVVIGLRGPLPVREEKVGKAAWIGKLGSFCRNRQ